MRSSCCKVLLLHMLLLLLRLLAPVLYVLDIGGDHVLVC